MKRRELFSHASGMMVGGLAGMAASPAAAARQGPSLSAAEFGARGDGKADDTDAIQAALDATIGSGRAGLLVIPPGTYRISRTLRVELTRDGAGKLTRMAGISAYGAQLRSAIKDGSDVFALDSRTVARFLLIEGLEIRGNGSEGTGFSLTCDGQGHYIYNACLRDMVVEGCGKDGCSMIGNIFESQVINAYFRDNRRNGMSLGHGNDGGVLSALHFFGCVFGGNRKHGVTMFRRANDVSFHGCYFLLNGRFGLVASNGCMLLSHCGFENNHERAESFAKGDAGLRIKVFGTLIGCFAYSIRHQKHLLSGYITDHLVMIGCRGSGGAEAKGAGLARVEDNGKAEVTIIGSSGKIESAGGITPTEIGQRGFGARFGSAWNSRNLVRLGDYSLWVDGEGALRMKEGTPSSDRDGWTPGAEPSRRQRNGKG